MTEKKTAEEMRLEAQRALYRGMAQMIDEYGAKKTNLLKATVLYLASMVVAIVSLPFCLFGVKFTPLTWKQAKEKS